MVISWGTDNLFVRDSYVAIADRILAYAAAPISRKSQYVYGLFGSPGTGKTSSFTIFFIDWCVRSQIVLWSGQEAAIPSILMYRILDFSVSASSSFASTQNFEVVDVNIDDRSMFSHDKYEVKLTHFYLFVTSGLPNAEFTKFVAPYEHHEYMPTWWETLDFVCSLHWMLFLYDLFVCSRSGDLMKPFKLLLPWISPLLGTLPQCQLGLMYAVDLLGICFLIWISTPSKTQSKTKRPTSKLTVCRRLLPSKWKGFERFLFLPCFVQIIFHFQVDDHSHGSGALIVFDPREEDVHHYGLPMWVSPYVKIALAASAFVGQQTRVQEFLRADVLQPQSTSLLACELFESFSILQLCHKGNVQVIVSLVVFLLIGSSCLGCCLGLSSSKKLQAQSQIPDFKICSFSNHFYRHSWCCPSSSCRWWLDWIWIFEGLSPSWHLFSFVARCSIGGCCCNDRWGRGESDSSYSSILSSEPSAPKEVTQVRRFQAMARSISWLLVALLHGYSWTPSRYDWLATRLDRRALCNIHPFSHRPQPRHCWSSCLVY